MGRLAAYKVDLKGLTEGSAHYDWVVDGDFFAALDVEDIQNGNLRVAMDVEKESGMYILDFSLRGNVIVPCDRCLDDMTLDIETSGSLKVRLGEDFADDGEVVVVPEEDGTINVAWYVYEFISLAVPLKHVHLPGMCNKVMAEKLDALSVDGEETGDGGTDPRWAGLENLNLED